MQACAFGCRPVEMTYDGDVLHVAPIALAVPLHFVLVDLRAAKDTIIILSRLQARQPHMAFAFLLPPAVWCTCRASTAMDGSVRDCCMCATAALPSSRDCTRVVTFNHPEQAQDLGFVCPAGSVPAPGQ